MVCYREGILRFQILSYNDTQRSLVVVTPMYSKFRNNYVRDNVDEIFDFEWGLASVQGSNSTNNNMMN